MLKRPIFHRLTTALFAFFALGGIASAQREMPAVKVTIIPNPAAADRAAVIGGAGELGVPTLAPALANAYYRLTKKRVRSLPFFPNATMGGL